jgi:hypothetical protein
VASAATAQATRVSCGQTITHDTTLTVDLINCPGDGLVIGADNLTLNLNRHTIDGMVGQLPACDEPPFGNDGIRRHHIWQQSASQQPQPDRGQRDLRQRLRRRHLPQQRRRQPRRP